MNVPSVFDVFKIGVGPSSSHTMGPWLAGRRFVDQCRRQGIFDSISRIHVELFGSLAKTGRGHGTDLAAVMGLMGEDPVTCDTQKVPRAVADADRAGRLTLHGERTIPFASSIDLLFRPDVTLDYHPNGMTFTASLTNGQTYTQTWYSVGGGFIEQADGTGDGATNHPPRLPFETARELHAHCRREGLSIAEVVRCNELVWRSAEEIRAGLNSIWSAMQACIHAGCHTEGVLPGGLGVTRRAAKINRSMLGERPYEGVEDWKRAISASVKTGQMPEWLAWVSCFALAVNEQNAAYGRVVTAPTNGAAGVVPAVLMYCDRFCGDGSPVRPHEPFLLAAAAVASLFKSRATLSAAMGGCQAEIGVASAMAAAGLAQCLGGTCEQVLMAAEIAMEHHLGLTCDPVAGLVQIPCIERNTMGAVKAITACTLALSSDPAQAKVPLDAVIASMSETGRNMDQRYKETAEGGLALRVRGSICES